MFFMKTRNRHAERKSRCFTCAQVQTQVICFGMRSAFSPVNTRQTETLEGIELNHQFIERQQKDIVGLFLR